jgi:hypothetical protein
MRLLVGMAMTKPVLQALLCVSAEAFQAPHDLPRQPVSCIACIHQCGNIFIFIVSRAAHCLAVGAGPMMLCACKGVCLRIPHDDDDDDDACTLILVPALPDLSSRL